MKITGKTLVKTMTSKDGKSTYLVASISSKDKEKSKFVTKWLILNGDKVKIQDLKDQMRNSGYSSMLIDVKDGYLETMEGTALANGKIPTSNYLFAIDFEVIQGYKFQNSDKKITE